MFTLKRRVTCYIFFVFYEVFYIAGTNFTQGQDFGPSWIIELHMLFPEKEVEGGKFGNILIILEFPGELVIVLFKKHLFEFAMEFIQMVLLQRR